MKRRGLATVNVAYSDHRSKIMTACMSAVSMTVSRRP